MLSKYVVELRTCTHLTYRNSSIPIWKRVCTVVKWFCTSSLLYIVCICLLFPFIISAAEGIKKHLCIMSIQMSLMDWGIEESGWKYWLKWHPAGLNYFWFAFKLTPFEVILTGSHLYIVVWPHCYWRNKIT